jgi:hypothetical protein
MELEKASSESARLLLGTSEYSRVFLEGLFQVKVFCQLFSDKKPNYGVL